MAKPRKRILCIEDDRETAALIAEELADREFEVSTACDGQEGFVAILKDKPDLVLCDIGVPIISGFAVLERLTELAPRLGRVPFVFLTALADRNSELRGRRLGADDYVHQANRFRYSCHHQRSAGRSRAHQAEPQASK